MDDFVRHLRRAVTRGAALAATVALLWAAAPAGAHAQQGELEVDGSGGIAFPAEDLADLSDIGPAFRAGGTYWITDHVGARLDGGLEILPGAELPGGLGSESPDFTLWRYQGGFEFLLTPVDESRWSSTFGATVGATTIDTDQFPLGVTTTDGESAFTETYFSGAAHVGVGYAVTESVDVVLDGALHLAFTDEEDTRVFTQFNTEVDSDGYGSQLSFPIHLGAKISL